MLSGKLGDCDRRVPGDRTGHFHRPGRCGCRCGRRFRGQWQGAEETVSEIEKRGRRGMMIQADVSQADQVDSAVKQVLDAFGRIDILVNNAGITRDNLVLRMKEEDWDRVIDTNLKGTFLFSKAVIRPMMKQRSGRIINIGSVVGVSGNPGQANYVAAKAGVIGMTKAMARELASRRITVNAVAPGFIETDMTAVLGDEVRAQIKQQIPLARFGSPERRGGRRPVFGFGRRRIHHRANPACGRGNGDGLSPVPIERGDAASESRRRGNCLLVPSPRFLLIFNKCNPFHHAVEVNGRCPIRWSA